jgi:DNA-binding NarL/FixJ family response regulator
VNIFLAHQGMLFREGLKRVLAELESGIAFLEADNRASLVGLSDDCRGIELALIEFGLPGPGPTNPVARLVERRPSLPVVVVAPAVAPEQVAIALADGARGFVPETVSAHVLIQALRLAMVGGVYVPPGVYHWAEGSTRQEGARPHNGPHGWHAQWGPGTALTERQEQVLELLSQGKSNKLIARELGIAEGTVKCHVASVLRMLNVRNRTSAAMAASRWVGAATMARAGPQNPLTH